MNDRGECLGCRQLIPECTGCVPADFKDPSALYVGLHPEIPHMTSSYYTCESCPQGQFYDGVKK